MRRMLVSIGSCCHRVAVFSDAMLTLKISKNSLQYAGDLIFAAGGHQQILIFLLSDMNSFAGLKVKVISRDKDDFPGGYHYHMVKGWMKQMIDGKKNPYIFHMCWTQNKEDKLKYMKQMGMVSLNEYAEIATQNENI